MYKLERAINELKVWLALLSFAIITDFLLHQIPANVLTTDPTSFAIGEGMMIFGGSLMILLAMRKVDV